MTPEGKVKQDIKDYLATLGAACWYCMPMNFGYGKNGVPDFIICYRGFFLAPETKKKGGKSEPWQIRELEAIGAAGGVSARVTDVKQIKVWVKIVDKYLAAHEFCISRL